MSTSQGNALRPSLPCCPFCHVVAVQREAFASPFPPAASHSRPVFFFPCNFPTPRRISWPSSLQLGRRNFVAAWQQLHGTRCTSARPPRANAPAARQASSCIMHTHPAPCLLERTRNAAGQIPPSLGQAQIPYAEAATLGQTPNRSKRAWLSMAKPPYSTKRGGLTETPSRRGRGNENIARDQSGGIVLRIG